MPTKSVARTAQLVKPLVDLLRLQHEVNGSKDGAGTKISESDLFELAKKELGKRGYEVVPKGKA